MGREIEPGHDLHVVDSLAYNECNIYPFANLDHQTFKKAREAERGIVFVGMYPECFML
jgi:hypothetical protein